MQSTQARQRAQRVWNGRLQTIGGQVEVEQLRQFANFGRQLKLRRHTTKSY
jgi:hypothetical protein